jgi:hypothetical protein
MRLVEECPCGGRIELGYEIKPQSYGRGEESGEAREQLGVFRRAHKPCLKRLGEQAAKPPATPEKAT